jgi:hypothetical protein
MGEYVAGNIGGDHDFRAKGARRRHRHRVHQCAVDQPAIAHHDRCEYPRQGVRRPQRVDNAAMGQPNLVTGTHFGRDGGKFHRPLFDQARAHRSLELGGKLGAGDQA